MKFTTRHLGTDRGLDILAGLPENSSRQFSPVSLLEASVASRALWENASCQSSAVPFAPEGLTGFSRGRSPDAVGRDGTPGTPSLYSRAPEGREEHGSRPVPQLLTPLRGWDDLVDAVRGRCPRLNPQAPSGQQFATGRSRLNPQAPSGQRSPTGRTRAGGMTIMELLVAMAVLAVLILVFNLILSQSQKVVKGGQAKMQANSAVAAIGEVMRTDIRQASQNGFLCITQADTYLIPYRPPQVFLATAGPAPSLTGIQKATGTVTAYGLCNVPPPGGTDPALLWRASWLLLYGGPAAAFDRDIVNTDLGWVQRRPRGDINLVVVDSLRTATDGSMRPIFVPVTLTTPPETLENVNVLWKYLASNCKALSVMWTDGSDAAAGAPVNLNWYGITFTIDYSTDPKGIVSYGVVPKDNNWSSKDITTSGAVEFDAGSDVYRALWTNEDQQAWPKAVKFRFVLSDPALPTEFTSLEYEIICPIGQ